MIEEIVNRSLFCSQYITTNINCIMRSRRSILAMLNVLAMLDIIHRLRSSGGGRREWGLYFFSLVQVLLGTACIQILLRSCIYVVGQWKDCWMHDRIKDREGV